jgi:hypothetical protein
MVVELKILIHLHDNDRIIQREKTTYKTTHTDVTIRSSHVSRFRKKAIHVSRLDPFQTHNEGHCRSRDSMVVGFTTT